MIPARELLAFCKCSNSQSVNSYSYSRGCRALLGELGQGATPPNGLLGSSGAAGCASSTMPSATHPALKTSIGFCLLALRTATAAFLPRGLGKGEAKGRHSSAKSQVGCNPENPGFFPSLVVPRTLSLSVCFSLLGIFLIVSVTRPNRQ